MKTNLLKDWNITLVNGKDVIICGFIYNDIKKRFEDSTYIHTSKVLKADFVNGIVETRNSVYHLAIKE